MINPFQGTLDGGELGSKLRSLRASKATGVLRVAKDGREKRIVLQHGRIVSVSSDTEEEDPSRALVGTSEAESTPAEFERAAFEAVLAWGEGEYQYRFEEGDPRSTPAEGEKESSRVIRWAENATAFAEVTLSTKESTLLDFLRYPANQNLTASEIVARSPLSDAETIQILTKLLEAGVLEDREGRRPSDSSPTLAGARLEASEPSLQPAIPPPSSPQKLGRFVVERTLGRGSMGAVLLAKDPAIDRIVAIKLVQTASHLSSSQSEKYHERFYREASAAGQLHHPKIATVFDVGHTDDGTPFIVMEYVKGRTLREALEAETFSVSDTLSIARDILEALGFAHSQGIVHRDVKPTNVMVTPDRHAKIMDFGIAHVVGSELTSAEDVLGSPYYMAPEQLSKGPIGPSTDLFSLAVVLYRMLTGVLPFTGESFAAIAHAILHERPLPPEKFSPRIPKSLSRIVLRCLEKAPEDRYQSADEVLRALDDAASGKETPLLPPRSRARIPSVGGARRSYTLAALVVVGLLTLLATELSFETTPPPTMRWAQAPAPPVVARPPVPGTPVPGKELARPAPVVESKPQSRTTRPTVEPSSPPRKETKPPSPAADPAPRVTPHSAVSAAPVGAPVDKPPTASVAELFYQARLALERGELEEAKTRLADLLARDPAFAGGAELYVQVTDELWERRLPIAIPARHDHRLGGCEGELSLATLGVRFHSQVHDWAFAREDIRVMEHPDESTLIVETFEKDLLGLGKNKRYRFLLETPLREEDWVRYQRLLK